MIRRRTLVAAALVLILSAGTTQAQTLYGITTNNELITINRTTGAGSIVGPLSSNMNAPGLAFRGNKLYTWDTVASRIRELDPATGAVLNTIDIGLAAGAGGDFAFRSDGAGFLTNPATRFCTFDVTVPSSSVVATLSPGMSGLAFNATGVLFGLNSLSADLYTLNPTTGAATLVGNTGMPSLGANGLAFDSGGKLFAVGGSDLYEVNPATGAATLIGAIGVSGVSGLAFQPAVAPAPPPGALYGVTIVSNELITINTATAAGTLVGPLSSNMNAFGIAFRGPRLYAWDDVADRIRELDLASGATLNTINIGLISAAEGDIVFRGDGIGFISGQGPPSLHRVDITVPSAALIGPLSPPMDGLAFNAAGVMFGLSDGGGTLYIIDPLSAATTLVGPTGITVPTINTSGGLAFDASGTLFAVLSPWPPGPSLLYRINPSNGAATLVGNIGFNGVSGLAFRPVASAPPPPRGPTGNEGSFPGSRGNGGAEGTFGGGGRLSLPRSRQALLGPFLEPGSPLGMTVFNVSHRQTVPTEMSQTSRPYDHLTNILIGLALASIAGVAWLRSAARDS